MDKQDGAKLLRLGPDWRPPMVAPEHARTVMAAYTAADLSAATGQPVDLPLSNMALSAIAEMKGGTLAKAS